MSSIKIYHARVSNIYTLPERIGAYILTHTHNNVNVSKYVGSTINLHRRMYGHRIYGLWEKVIYVDLYVTDSISLARSLEKILINLIRPVTNAKIASLSDKDKELMYKLFDENIIKDKYLSENVIKIGCRYLKFNKRRYIDYREYI